MTTKAEQTAIVKRMVLAVALFDPDDPMTYSGGACGPVSCVGCGEVIAIGCNQDRTEPTALCDGCAQEWATEFARRLRKAWKLKS